VIDFSVKIGQGGSELVWN